MSFVFARAREAFHILSWSMRRRVVQVHIYAFDAYRAKSINNFNYVRFAGGVIASYLFEHAPTDDGDGYYSHISTRIIK